ncbi:MAG TPA: BPSS1780 family membrane protein [Thiopseudomonas sp.]|nr:BPSS1780 family membrane protein [Thiopseudomonas sp.]
MKETIGSISESPSLSPTQLRSEPHTVSAGRGLKWLTEGWALLRKEPLMFIAMSVISLIGIFIINLIPLLGSLATVLFWPALAAGFFLAFKHAQQDQPVSVNDLFEPFKTPGSLIGVGGMYLLASIVIMLFMFIIAFIGFGSFSAIVSGDIDMERMTRGFIIITLVSIPVSLAFVMAFAFAPVLVHQHNVPVIEAIKRSFSGSLRNIRPFIVFFAVLTLCFILLSAFVVVPLIGLLISMAMAVLYLPLFCGALFCAYRDIFLQPSNPEL